MSHPPLTSLGRVHIVGIAGAGMSAIARILLGRGVPVSGSDARQSRRLTALAALGARVHVGHDPAHVDDVDTLIISTAVREDNVEVARARERGITVLSRAEGLACMLDGAATVAIAGTHGKTTTTSMLTVALQGCGVDPTFIIGSELNESGTNAHVGSADLTIVEADESDGTFLHLSPMAAVITNIEPDHMDHWGTIEAIEDAFLQFALRVRDRDGFLVVCADDAGALRVGERARAAGVDVRTYGVSPNVDHRIELGGRGPHGWTFTLTSGGVRHEPITLAVPGEHNVLNATAALVVGMGLGRTLTQLRRGLEDFTGTRRRFELRGVVNGVRVFDDYAHHPTAVQATVRAARDVAGHGRVLVACQPYRWYRTAMFIPEYGEALRQADLAYVLEVYGPGETPIPGASGQTVADAVNRVGGHAVFEPSMMQVAVALAAAAQPGDIILTLGAEDVSEVCPLLLEALAQAT